jgi:hypothetical protein
VEQGLTIEQLVPGRRQRRPPIKSPSATASRVFAFSSNDWQDFVEGHSLVEKVLRSDPGASTPAWTSRRDRYRHVVEEIARKSTCPERRSRTARDWPRPDEQPIGKRDERAAHVGYYLIDQGRPALVATPRCGDRRA